VDKKNIVVERMNQFTGFIFGDVDRPEFQFLHDSRFDFMRKVFMRSEDVNVCCGGIDKVEPDIIVIVQSYPDQFPSNFPYWILRCWSIVPVILLLGVGCVGEVRTGRPLAGCFRVYAHEWNEFWYNQLRRYAVNDKSIFDLPRTCSDDEFFLDATKNYLPDSAHKNCTSSKSKNVQDNICLIISSEGVLGNDYAMNKLLADYATSRGFSCVFSRQNLCIQPKLVLIDADDSGIEYIVESVQRLRSFFADSEFNVYINSPRFNEIKALRAVGVERVISKPFFW
jgi:hypothetical protein